MNLPVSLEKYIPNYEISFFNLKAIPAEKLVEYDHPFGWVLSVMQKEDANVKEFKEIVEQAVKHLEQIPFEKQANWSKLLHYLFMLIFNRREKSEQSDLFDIIEESILDKSRREEVKKMGKTIAQSLIDEGIEKGMQQLLIDALEIKFGSIPSDIIKSINNITGKETLKSLHYYAINSNNIDEFEEKLEALKNGKSSHIKNPTSRRKR